MTADESDSENKSAQSFELVNPGDHFLFVSIRHLNSGNNDYASER